MNPEEYSLDSIAKAIDAEKYITDNKVVRNILNDSRNYSGGEDYLFFALSGRHQDGHEFIRELYSKGLRNFVVTNQKGFEDLDEMNLLVVPDVLSALQKLASYHRANFEFPVIGITGSNGKTIVKEWLFQLLGDKYQIARSPRSFNSQLGVPLSLWQIKPYHNLAIIECGISQPGEMDRIEKMVKPDWGIFTNIGPPHQKNFESFREKALEKIQLFRHSKLLFSCGDHKIVQAVIKENFNGTNLTWGDKDKNTLQITKTVSKENQLLITGLYKDETHSINLPFSDEASLENACHCWLVMLHLGFSDEEIKNSMARLAPVAMRLEKRAGINDCILINDAYNSDFASLEIALDFLNQQSKGMKRIAILSDILQSGEKHEILYAKVARLLVRKGIEKVYAIGPEIGELKDSFKDLDADFIPDTESFLRSIKSDKFKESGVLVKGARKFQFERIVNRLEAKSHETTLTIDLNRMIDNLNYIRTRINPKTKIMAMVKAFAYGSGSAEIAAALNHAGVDYLAVAYADEGIQLRESNISTPIMVMNSENSAFDAMIRYRLEPQIFSFESLRKLISELKRSSLTQPLPIHVKINTGMNRLGFNLDEIDKVVVVLKENNTLVEVKSVFSHLAASDESDFDGLTTKQIERFLKACIRLESGGIKGFFRHILNSNGILRHPEAQFEMVRLGLALYGLSSHESFREALSPIGSLKSVISQIRTVSAGEGIGYSPKETLQENKRIGVIAIGYADGLRRVMGNGAGYVFLNGKKAPFIGNICMDMSMIDLEGIPCRVGDEVEIFGDNISIYDFAKTAETIPYEILTAVSGRVKRVYFRE